MGGSMATVADQRRWREAMENMGAENVRHKLYAYPFGMALGEREQIIGIDEDPPHPGRNFVEAWLAEKCAAERRERAWILACAIIAAATGIIAVILNIAALMH